MFTIIDDLNTKALFQGDIIKDIQYLGAINLNTVFFAKSSSDEVTHWGVANPPKIGPAIILSHSCEISRENDIKVTSIILAPIRDINKATHPKKIQELIDSNLIKNDSKFSYLKYFYLKPQGFLKKQYPGGCVVDFSKCYSIHKNAYENLLVKKVLEMNEQTRKSFSLKNALFFFREGIPKCI